MNAMLQMTDRFVDKDEQKEWNDDQREISNITHSFSGRERNRLFLNVHAEQFLDLSGLSGLDSPADGRVFVRLDYDRDGWSDFAVVNSSRPFLQLYRNRLGELRSPSTKPVAASKSPGNNLIAVRFAGGNVSASPSTKFSHRDGWGAKALLTIGEKGHERTLLREHLCGEGMAGQNSSTMLVGIGTESHARQIEIRWPSGVKQTLPRIEAGSLVTVFEDPAASPRDEPYVIEPYRRPVPTPAAPIPLANEERRFDVSTHSTSELTVVTTMASWCAACAKHQPLLDFLPVAFEDGEVGVVGFPLDREDPTEAVQEFASRHNAAYALMLDPAAVQRDAIESILGDAAGADALPSSIVTDAAGRVLLVQAGIPTVSQLRQLLADSRARSKRVAKSSPGDVKNDSE